jgi:UDP-N-acetylmuramate: L-alanyl-gamma-D-glutamyl-meso-diaminopimelate ligase
MKIYFIAICGKGVGNLAIFLKQQGHDVYGSEFSENTFYSPMADYIKDVGIKVDFGFDPEKITKDIDLVILGGATFIHDQNNPQVAKAKELGIETISFASGIGRFISQEENIEVVGNHGKTTTTSLIAWLLNGAGKNPSYFIGEAPHGFENSIHRGDSKWFVAEGDEHPTLNVEPGGKFLYHHPKHIVFTSADWDHKNIYKTEEEYLNSFRELFKIQPKDGIIVSNLDGIKTKEVLNSIDNKNKVILYTISVFNEIKANETENEIDILMQKELKTLKTKFENLYKNLDSIFYIASIDYKLKPDTTRFLLKKISKNGECERINNFETPLIGQVGLENSIAAISTLCSLGIDIEKIKKPLENFQGAKRRLELVYNREYKVINDFAHSPIKIKSALKAIRSKYYDNKIFVIFHITQSGLKEKQTFNQLKKAFNYADYVIIPKVTSTGRNAKEFFGRDYRDIIKQGAEEETQFLEPKNVYYTPLLVQMRSVLENNLSPNDIIVIMSSGDANELLDTVIGLRINNN